MSLNTVSFGDIVAGEEYSFAALYGMQNDKRSHFLAKLMAAKKSGGTNCQFVLIMNPERELQHQQAQQLQTMQQTYPQGQEQKSDVNAATDNNTYFPFLNELQFLGIPKQLVDVRRMDFRKWVMDQEAFEAYSSSASVTSTQPPDAETFVLQEVTAAPAVLQHPDPFLSSYPIVLVFDDSHGISRLSDYVKVLTPMIQANGTASSSNNTDGFSANAAGTVFDSTFLVFDDVRAIANLDGAPEEDVQLFVSTFIQPRRDLKLSIMMAPEIQFCEQIFPSISKELDYILFADKPLTYAGLKMWQRQHFRAFHFGLEEQELVDLFAQFSELRNREQSPLFKALIIHRFRNVGFTSMDESTPEITSNFPNATPTYLETVEFAL